MKTLLIVLLAAAATASAQTGAESHVIVAAGPVGLFGSANSHSGLHGRLGLQSRPAGHSYAFRVEGIAMMNAVAEATPTCITGPCNSFSDPYPKTLFGGSLSLVVPLED